MDSGIAGTVGYSIPEGYYKIKVNYAGDIVDFFWWRIHSRGRDGGVLIEQIDQNGLLKQRKFFNRTIQLESSRFIVERIEETEWIAERLTAERSQTLEHIF